MQRMATAPDRGLPVGRPTAALRPTLVGGALIVVLAVLLGGLRVAEGSTARPFGMATALPSPGTTLAPLTARRDAVGAAGSLPAQSVTSALIPISGAEMSRVALALVGGPDPAQADTSELALVAADGTEVWRGPSEGWFPDAEHGLVYDQRPGGVVLVTTQTGGDPVVGCEAVHGNGLVRTAVCGDLSRSTVDEIRVISPNGHSRMLTGLVDGIGSWRVAFPSPDGGWVLAQSGSDCDSPTAYLFTVTGTGRRLSDPGDSVAMGWLADGHAAIGVLPGSCSDTSGPGTYLIDPRSGNRTRIHPFYFGAVITGPLPAGSSPEG